MTATREDIGRALSDIVGNRYVWPLGVEPDDEGRVQPTDAAAAWRIAPSSAAEIAGVVALANRHGVAIVPVGSGTRGVSQAGLAGRLCCLVETQRMDHVLRLDETSLIVHVQAGISVQGLRRVLAPRRLSLGDYPPAAMRSSIGGLLAVRTPGKSSPRHGFIEDAVLGLSAVLADGRTIHTRMAPRRSTGPDLARALCGSEGTLGFITSVYLRIHRRPESRFFAAYVLPELDAALSAVYLALREEAAPAALRVYDHAAAEAMLGVALERPAQAVLTVATAGPTDLAVCDRDLVASAAEAMGGAALDEAVAERWWRRRNAQDAEPAAPAPALQVTAAPASQRRVYHAVCDAADAAAVDVRGYVSRFDYDGAVLFFSFIDRASGDALGGDALDEVRRATAQAACDAGALPLGSRNRDLAPYLVELRALLDPNEIMNPGALATTS